MNTDLLKLLSSTYSLQPSITVTWHCSLGFGNIWSYSLGDVDVITSPVPVFYPLESQWLIFTPQSKNLSNWEFMVEEGPHICGLILCFKGSGYVALLFTLHGLF